MNYQQYMRAAEKRREQIKGLHAKRWTAKEIAAKFRITTQRVYAICGPFKANGVKGRR